MSAEEPEASGILKAGVAEDAVLVRVEGAGSYALAPTLKRFGLACLEQNLKLIVLDMKECSCVDSTFVGVLASLAMKTARAGGRMALANVRQRAGEALTTLGLGRLLAIHREGEPMPDELRGQADWSQNMQIVPITPALDRNATKRAILEAHEDLARVSNENLKRFRDVLAVLRQEIKPGS